jgi:glycerol kinase
VGALETAAQSEELAGSLAGNEGVYFVPAFVGMGAPHWEPDARGMLVGLTRGSGKAVLARAALESMAYQTADVLEAMARDSGLALAELRVDGGAALNDWLMRFQADVLGVRVRRPAMVETTALGAAGLAGLAAGVWATPEAFLEAGEAPAVFSPGMDHGERDALRTGWRRAVSAALHWTRWDATSRG